jgi:ATP synthase protein I
MGFLPPEGRKQLRQATKVGAIGLELGLAVLVGYFGGRWIDTQLGSTPWFMYIGFVCGVLAGFKSLYRIATTVDLDEL